MSPLLITVPAGVRGALVSSALSLLSSELMRHMANCHLTSGQGWVRALDRPRCLLAGSASCWGPSGATPPTLWLRGAERVSPWSRSCAACLLLSQTFHPAAPSISGEEKGSGKWAEYLVTAEAPGQVFLPVSDASRDSVTSCAVTGCRGPGQHLCGWTGGMPGHISNGGKVADG